MSTSTMPVAGSGMNLTSLVELPTKQWATRPDDERFWTVEEARKAAWLYAQTAKEQKIEYAQLEVTPVAGQQLALMSRRTGALAVMTNWAFGQLSGMVGAPAGYLRKLPEELAASCLNEGLYQRTLDGAEAAEGVLLTHNGGDRPRIARAITSDRYTRVWNWEVLQHGVEPLMAKGWKVPPGRPTSTPGNLQAALAADKVRYATERDVIKSAHPSLGVRVGDLIGPSGVYVSDHDCFVFLVQDSRSFDFQGKKLTRFMLVLNSEVGASSLTVVTGLLEEVCGNHILWGVAEESLRAARFRHIGEGPLDKFREQVQVTLHALERTKDSDTLQQLEKSATMSWGLTNQAALEAVFKALSGEAPKKQLAAAQEASEQLFDTDPRTSWGIVQGLSWVSQQQPHQDVRHKLDRAAARLLEVF